MGKINRISDFIGPLKTDVTGKKLQLDGIDNDSGQNFVVYGRDGAGQWRERTDASLQVGGGPGGSDFIKTSDYVDMNAAIADATALNKVLLVDSVTKLSHPTSQNRGIAAIQDASITVPFSVSGGGAAFLDQNNIASGGPYNINTNATPKSVSPFTSHTTYLDNTLKDYSITKTFAAGNATDIGGGIVELPMASSVASRNDFSPGHRVKIDGSVNYNDPAGYIVAENVDQWNNPTKLRIFAPFVAEAFNNTMTVTRGLIGIPVDDHQITFRRAIVVRNSGTYLDDQILWTDLATYTTNPNEIVVEAFYQPTTFTQGQVFAARARLPVFNNTLTGTNQSSQLSVTISGTAGGILDGDYPVKYIGTKPSGSNLNLDPDYVVIEGIIPDDTVDLSLAGTITFHRTRFLTPGFNFNANGSRINCRGFTNPHYNQVFRTQANSVAGSVIVNQPFSAEVLNGNEAYVSVRHTVTSDLTVLFSNPNYYIVFERGCNIDLNCQFIIPEVQKAFHMEDPSLKDIRKRSIVRFLNGMEVNAGHWGLVYGNNRANAPINDPAMINSMNAAGDSPTTYRLPAGAINFSGWIVGETTDIGANVEKLGTNDIVGAGMNQTTLFLAGGANQPLFFMNDQSYHNAMVSGFTISGNAAGGNRENSSNPCMHPLTPMYQSWGFNVAYFNIHVTDCPGGGMLVRAGQSNSHNFIACEMEVCNTYGLQIHGVLRTSVVQASFEACKDGLLVTPSPNNGTWFAPDSMVFELSGCYFEANLWDLSLMGVRSCLARTFNLTTGAVTTLRARIGNWQGIGSMGCEMDFTNGAQCKVLLDSQTRHNSIKLPLESSSLTSVQDYGKANRYSRPGVVSNEIPKTTDASGMNAFQNTNLAIAGGASVAIPYGDGTNKWHGSTIFSDAVAFINDSNINIPTRWQAIPTGPGTGTVNFQASNQPDGVYYLRMLLKAHPTWYLRFRVVDTLATEVFDWRDQVWVPGLTLASGADIIVIPPDNSHQFLSWELPFNGQARTIRWPFFYTNNGLFAEPDSFPFVIEYFDLVNSKTRGLVHKRDGEETHIGLIDQKWGGEYNSAATIRAYESDILVDSTGGSFTLSLPENPHPGESHNFTQKDFAINNNDVTIDGGSRNIGTAGSIILSNLLDYESVTLTYYSQFNRWIAS